MANQKSKAGDEAGPNARVGTVIKGKWTIESLLGVGGMAAVYAASHRNGQRAALKILHADFSREKTICERFLREAYVSNKVNHAATVQVLDDDMTEAGEPFLIMELLEGETVRDAWKKCGRTMPAGRVLQICERVLDCLASCHAIKVIHRDLKPANIFITNEDVIKVLDFGVAQMRDATSERTATGTALGTPAYMSPEQAMGLVDQLDGRADLFSVGAMMHALITGHRINNGRTEQEALVMAATKPVPSVARIASQLPIELIKIIDKSLAWDRRNRFQDARDMQRALTDLMPSQGVAPLGGKAAPRPNEVVAPPAEMSPAPAPAANAPPAPPAQTAPMAPPVAPPAAPAAPAYDPLVGYAPPLTPAAPSAAPAPAAGPSLPTSGAGGSSAPGGVPAEVPENDPRVQTIRDLMRHFDRLLPNVRQLGWPHPATERVLKTAYDAFVEALKNQPSVVTWTVRPYSFMSLGHQVWEPSAPFDAIPYNLFACGIRTLKIEPGVSLEEMRELLGLLLLDPGRDLPPEDDLAAALWEKSLPHVVYHCADAFAEGDAAEREAFYGEADDLEKLAEVAAKNQMSDVEAKAMALSTDDAALKVQKERSPFALDDVMRQNVSPLLEMTREAWAERYVDALVEGYLDAASNRDAPLILASLRKSSADLVVASRMGVAIQISQAVIERLRQRVQGDEARNKLAAALTNAMFGGETFEIILTKLREDPSGIEIFQPVLLTLSANELPTAIGKMREPLGPQLRAAVAMYVERHIGGREAQVAAAAPGADSDGAAYFVQLLGRMGTPAARQLLLQLAQHEDPNVRIEARVLLAPSPDMAQNEIASLIDGPTALVRIAALRTAIRYGMRNVWPTVTRVIGGKTFNELGADERRELLRACIVLSPERGEPMLVDIVKKSGMLMSEEREVSRAIAAELLGEHSRSRTTAAALQEITATRWGVSEETRIAASSAAQRIAYRFTGGGGPTA